MIKPIYLINYSKHAPCNDALIKLNTAYVPEYLSCNSLFECKGYATKIYRLHL